MIIFDLLVSGIFQMQPVLCPPPVQMEWLPRISKEKEMWYGTSWFCDLLQHPAQLQLLSKLCCNCHHGEFNLHCMIARAFFFAINGGRTKLQSTTLEHFLAMFHHGFIIVKHSIVQ